MLAVSISLDWLCCLLCVSSSLFVRSQGSSVNRMLCIEQNGIVSCLQLPVISSPSGPTHLISADGRCHTNYCLGLPNSANSFKLDHTASQCRSSVSPFTHMVQLSVSPQIPTNLPLSISFDMLKETLEPFFPLD